MDDLRSSQLQVSEFFLLSVATILYKKTDRNVANLEFADQQVSSGAFDAVNVRFESQTTSRVF
jgi:hypothetical protein